MALSNDGRIISLKHKVLYHVAKKTFEGTLEEERDNLPEEKEPRRDEDPERLHSLCARRCSQQHNWHRGFSFLNYRRSQKVE